MGPRTLSLPARTGERAFAVPWSGPSVPARRGERAFAVPWSGPSILGLYFLARAPFFWHLSSDFQIRLQILPSMPKNVLKSGTSTFRAPLGSILRLTLALRSDQFHVLFENSQNRLSCSKTNDLEAFSPLQAPNLQLNFQLFVQVFLYATAWLTFSSQRSHLDFQVSPCVPLGAELANQLTNHCPQSWSWTFPRWTWRHILATSSPFLLTWAPGLDFKVLQAPAARS